jgi:hypothetical protein
MKSKLLVFFIKAIEEEKGLLKSVWEGVFGEKQKSE